MNNTIFPPVPVLKEQAKAALRQAGPAMTKASLVYIGITLIVNYALQGTAPEGKELQVFALTMLVNLLLNLLDFGFRGLCLDCARGEQELPLTGLLAGTHLPLRVMGLFLLEGVLALFYGIPYILGIVLVGALTGLVPALGLLIMIPATVWACWGVMKIAARYAMAPFILWDRPEMPAMDCLNLSRTMMEGHEGKYIWLELSFFGWLLLSALTMGIAMIWFNPWMHVTIALFYRAGGGDKIAGLDKAPEEEQPQEHDDLKDAFTTSAYRDSEEK